MIHGGPSGAIGAAGGPSAVGAWSPLALAPLAWLDPSVGALLSLTGSVINSIADRARGLVFSKVGSPTLDTAHNLNGRPAITLTTTGELVCATGGITGATAHTLMVCADFNATAASQPDGMMRFGPKSNTEADRSPLGLFTNPYYSGGDANGFEPQLRTPAPDGAIHVLDFEYTGTVKRGHLDGVFDTGANNSYAIAYNVTGASMALGRFDATRVSNASRIRQALWFDRVLTVVERQKIVTYWCRAFSVAATACNVAAVGDSQLSGEDATAGHDPLTLAMATVNAARTGAGKVAATSANYAVPGLTTTEILATVTVPHAPQVQSPYLAASARRQREVAVIEGGPNDVLNSAANGSADPGTVNTAIANFTSAAALFHALGHRVVFMTIIPLPTSEYDVTWKLPRVTAINAWMRTTALAAGICDAVCDSDTAGLVYPTDYNVNNIHLLDSGQAKVGAVLAVSIASVLP